MAEWLPAPRKLGFVAILGAYALLSGCGLIPECVCTEIKKPPPPIETPVAPDPAPPLPAPAPPPSASMPSLPAAPLPPSVTQAPLDAPPAPQPTPIAPRPPTATAPAAGPVVTPAPRYGAQLGAFRSLANANGAWERFKARYIDLLATVPGPLLREVDLGPKGKFVRVMAGPFANDQEARSLCLEVQARGGFCYVQPLGR